MKTDGGVPIAIGGPADHVHLLISLRPERAVSDMVRIVKSNLSKWVHETFQELEKFARQDGYGAFLRKNGILFDGRDVKYFPGAYAPGY